MGHSTKKLDLTGQQYGQLTVLERAENIGSRTAWHCRCACGNETIVKTCHLRSHHVTSCGCSRAGGGGIEKRLNYVDGTCVEMLRAKTVRSNNTSGVPGVDWWAAKHRWRATICFKGQRVYLGSYQKFEDAVNARKEAEENLHDRFVSEFSAEEAEQVECR